MITAYHGTVSTFLSSIHKHGLQPDFHLLQAKWLTNEIESQQTDEELRRARNSLGVVFAVENREFAEAFAQFRARFERAKHGDLVKYFDKTPQTLEEYIAAAIMPQFTKTGTQRHSDARPIVLTLEIPESLVIGRDPSTAGMPAIMLHAVPPQHIKHVDFLSEMG